MGKAKRIKPSRVGKKIPLEEDIEDAKFAKAKNRNKIRVRKDEDEQFVDSNLSQKILSAARKQQRELDSGAATGETSSKFKMPVFDDDHDSESEDEKEGVQDYDAFYENLQISEEDERAMEKFMSRNPVPSRTLADIIKEKATEKRTELETQFSDAGTMQLQDLDPTVKETYERVRDILKVYRSGKLPKAFKMIPQFKSWERILDITEPQSWSAAAMYQGTRIFTSNLPEKPVQRFFALVLLPRIRDDVAEYKRLNYHLHQALKKALYKPGAFMKGIILPLLKSGNCTLREATIIGSIIAKCQIKVLYSAAAMLEIAEMDYTGANSIFLRIFFDKKYALPYRVIDAVVYHFLRFENDPRELPVLWHQSLLVFVQRYKTNMSSEQRNGLLQLLKKQTHHLITPEVRRELESIKCRDVESVQPEMDIE